MMSIPIKSLILLSQTTDGSQAYCTDFTITEVCFKTRRLYQEIQVQCILTI